MRAYGHFELGVDFQTILVSYSLSLALHIIAALNFEGITMAYIKNDKVYLEVISFVNSEGIADKDQALDVAGFENPNASGGLRTFNSVDELTKSAEACGTAQKAAFKKLQEA